MDHCKAAVGQNNNSNNDNDNAGKRLFGKSWQFYELVCTDPEGKLWMGLTWHRSCTHKHGKSH